MFPLSGTDVFRNIIILVVALPPFPLIRDFGKPLVWPSNLPYVMLTGCDWWISIRTVNSTQGWRKFWKRFRGYFVFLSRVSTKTAVTEYNNSTRDRGNSLYLQCRFEENNKLTRERNYHENKQLSQHRFVNFTTRWNSLQLAKQL